MIKRLLTLTVLLLLIWGAARAGTKVSGRVADENGTPFPGVTVLQVGTTNGTVTGTDGNFELKTETDTNFKLQFSFIGYEDFVVSYNPESPPKNGFKVKMSVSTTELEQIAVVGTYSGQRQAMLDQKKATNIKNVVSSEQIDDFPDMNAAEAMQRIPGVTMQRVQGEGKYVQLRGTPPELTSFNINGEQIPSPEGDIRTVGMDVISSDQIDFIEVTKVLTPEMDGDAIGGSVNIITKKALSEKPEMKISAAAGYGNLRGKPNSNLQFAYGKRHGKIGFQVNASHYENQSGSDNLEFKYTKGPYWSDTVSGEDNYHMMYKQFQQRYYDYDKKRTGLSSTLDYRFNDKHSVYLRGMYNNSVDKEVRYRKIYGMEDAITFNSYLYGSVEHDVKARTKTQNISSLNLGGEDALGTFLFDYEFSYGLATENTPDRLQASFNNPGQALTFYVDDSDPQFPQVVIEDTAHYRIATEYENYKFDELLLQKSEVEDITRTAKLNLKKSYELSGKQKGYIKIGAKVRLRDKSRDETTQNYTGYRTTSRSYAPQDDGEELILTDIASDLYEDNLLDQGYVMEAMPSADKMRDFFEYNRHLFIFGGKGSTESRKRTYNHDYSAQEDIFAAYAMAQHEIGKFLVLGGVRYERTLFEYSGYSILEDSTYYIDTITPTGYKSEKPFVLPQVQMKYNFSDDFSMRAACTYSYTRPNFRDIIPQFEEDGDDITMGNPNIEFPASMNIDLLAEKYLKHNGIVSGGLFYKHIDNFIVYYKVNAFLDEFGAGGSPYEFSIPFNGIDAMVYGAELQSQFKFSKLPGVLANFGLYINYTFTESKAEIYKRSKAAYTDMVISSNDYDFDKVLKTGETEEVSLPGQAKHNANVALFYEGKRLFARLALNYQDDFLVSLGNDADLDEYYAASKHVDFTANYKLSKIATVFVDVVNLTNEPLVYYTGSKDYIKQQEYYSWWGRVGVKFHL